MDFPNAEGFKNYVTKVFWVTVAWIIISISQFLSGYFTLLSNSCNLEGMDPMLYLTGSLITGLSAGLLGGTFLVVVWERWLRSKTYGAALMLIFLSYSMIYFVVSYFTGAFFNSQQLNISPLSARVNEQIMMRMLSFESLHSYLIWLLIVIGTLILFQVNDKYGPGVFKDFLLGKYFKPKREERIFMFLDLRSSTTIAEKLGEERYFNFLRDVFNKVTPSILNAKGRIYQYVGDEIVISWIPEHGKENVNCLRCFFAIKGALNASDHYFSETYGFKPEFKAGLHVGNVMVGEIGMVKRDIAFSGDVLNTTSRIQNMCNDFGVDILFSKYLLDRIKPPPHTFAPKRIGDMMLRGKRNEVVLYTV